MTTRECFLWLRKRRERLEPVDMPNIPLAQLLREEEQRRERIGLLLSDSSGLPSGYQPDTVDEYLIYERLRFAEHLLSTMLSPGSPCRVRDWDQPRRLWWLLSVSWITVGVELWREREQLRAAFPPGAFAE